MLRSFKSFKEQFDWGHLKGFHQSSHKGGGFRRYCGQTQCSDSRKAQ